MGKERKTGRYEEKEKYDIWLLNREEKAALID